MAISDDELVRARRTLDLISPSDIIKWASGELATGRAEVQLVTLAATYDDGASVVDKMLDELLAEQKLETPNKQKSSLLVAYAIAREIFQGKISAHEGAHQIAQSNRAHSVDPMVAGIIGLADDWDDVVEIAGEDREEEQGKIAEQILLSAKELVERIDGEVIGTATHR